jgi:Tfp pilus assembly protein PilO
MGRRESRRVIVLAILVVIALALGVAWLRHLVDQPTPEERAREKAEELKEKVRRLTH